MIDVDRMEAQLAAALTDALRPLPSPAPAAAPALRPRRRATVQVPAPPPAMPELRRPQADVPAGAAAAVDLLALGRLDQADAAVAATSHPRDALVWTTMRALLEGRQEATRTGVEELRRLAQRTDDAEAWARYWMQRFWVAFEWGAGEERYDVLDHARDRAYRFDDLQWWGNLTLLLMALGKHEEASRAFDDAMRLVAVGAEDAVRLDVLTNLVEAAALQGDAGRVAAAARHLDAPAGRLVVVGEGVVCKGSVDRYLGLGHAALGQWAEAGECFRRAEATHRSIGAQPLLARTVQQAAGALVAV